MTGLWKPKETQSKHKETMRAMEKDQDEEEDDEVLMKEK